MWAELVEAGLEPKEARFYLAALTMNSPTVAQAAEAAQVSRTNGYDIAKRLAHRGLLSLAERSREVGRLAGEAVGVGRDLLGRHLVGRRRTTDVRRTGPRPRGRRDRQPAVRDDHDQEAEGRGGRGRPGHDATADVGAVLDPPADPRDR